MAALTLVETELIHTRTGDAEDAHHETIVRYLDLDGDGVPDAVEITETRVLMTADLCAEAVQIIVELDTGIGDDGIPTHVETSERLDPRAA
jgi:hypothetical protein